jgi:hypothetical protein
VQSWNRSRDWPSSEARRGEIISVSPGRSLEATASPGPSAVGEPKSGLKGPEALRRVENGPVPFERSRLQDLAKHGRGIDVGTPAGAD